MDRLIVKKTYKNFVDGQFPRTESGRHFEQFSPSGQIIANLCLSSRKDIRNAVVAARKGFAGWSTKSAFNRSQIFYRLAEMMEGRKTQLIDELQLCGVAVANAKVDVEQAIDLVMHYSGWCDKYQALLSSVNPVNSPHFNFSICEPMGVVGIIAPDSPSLTQLVSCFLPVMTSGNACVILANEKAGNCAITLSEILHCSDFNAGSINVLTGKLEELAETFGGHKDINALFICRKSAEKKIMKKLAAESVKRVIEFSVEEELDSLSLIEKFVELKTTWHPIEPLKSASSGY